MQEDDTMKALMIGCGNMGGALLKQWIRVDGVAFTVADPVAPAAHEAATYVRGPETLAPQSFDLCIIAIKPQLIDDVLPAYADRLKPGGAVASIAAGASAARLAALFETGSVVRIMPNMPSAIGKGVSGLFATSETPADIRNRIETLMRAAGLTVWVDTEDQLDRVTAVAGSGPGYVFELARVYVEAAKALGFADEDARKLVLGTMVGAVEMALQSNGGLAELRNAVTSRKGTTEAGLNALTRDGLLEQLFKDATAAAYARAVELR